MEVLIMNSSFENICWVDNFESLIWTERYDRCGDFELYVPYSKEILDLIKQDYYVYLSGSDQMMIVESIQISTDLDTGSHVLFSGRSLESILERRIVWKQTTYSGSFQNGIKKLLNENLISPEISARRVDGFLFETSSDVALSGLNVKFQVTGDNLYDTIMALCKPNNLGFKVFLNDANQMVFSLYSGVDRSYAQTENSYVVFSPNFENIINSNYLESKKTLKNVNLVAGEDSGANRKTRVVGSASGIFRREMYTDARDIQSESDEGSIPEEEYNELLDERGRIKLAENPETKSFEGQVEASKLFVYGQDFFMGDIVQVVNEYGVESRSRVTEFIRSQDISGIENYPTFSIVEE